MLNQVRAFFAAALFLTILSPQQTQSQTGSYGGPMQLAAVDPAIAVALKDVSPAQIHATIEKLVSFNNRSTLSSMERPIWRPAPASTPPPSGLLRSSSASLLPATTVLK